MAKTERNRAQSKRKVTANSASSWGRPGEDTARSLHNATVRNGTRVLLRGIRVTGSQQSVDVVGYVSNVIGGIAKVETWGAIKRPIMVPVSGLTFYQGK